MCSVLWNSYTDEKGEQALGRLRVYHLDNPSIQRVLRTPAAMGGSAKTLSLTKRPESPANPNMEEFRYFILRARHTDERKELSISGVLT